MKYIYNGMPLTAYCLYRNINYTKILGRIYRLKKLNVGLSDEEAVRLALENFIHGNTKYKYQGESLYKYCQNNNISYPNIARIMHNLQESNTDLSEDEIIRLIIENNINGNAKYIYQGESLYRYCQINGISYSNIARIINKLQKLNNSLSNEEAVRLALENYIHGYTKYIYQGVSLKDYCLDKGLNYKNILRKIKAIKKINIDMPLDEVIKLAIGNGIHGNAKYQYGGMSLSNYCKENVLNYESMLDKINRLKKLNVGLSDEEAVRLAIENNVNGNAKYIYQGESLYRYCQINSINYSTILNKMHKLETANPNLSNEEVIGLALTKKYKKRK